MFLKFFLEKKIILLIVLLLSINSKIFAKESSLNESIEPYCNGVSSEFFLTDQEIKKIEITTNKKRAWFKNILNAIIRFNSKESKTKHSNWFSFRIDDKLKKRFNSKITVHFTNNISCKFKGKIRMTGDLWWHIDWQE